MTAERCVCCGEIIPEGRQVCPICEKGAQMRRPLNMEVTLAGYHYIGHYRRGELKIVLEGGGWGCAVWPKDEFNLLKLFLVFGIDSEDGAMLEMLKGKPCRVICDEQGKVLMLQHITIDKIVWEVK